MYGLDAIANAHGWAMAITGICIVMSGLAILSLIISGLPKVVALLEKRKEERVLPKKEAPKTETPEKLEPPDVSPLELDKLAGRFEPLVKDLGDSFQLQKLYEVCRDKDFPHIHLSIRTLREAGVLEPVGDGFFCWHQ